MESINYNNDKYLYVTTKRYGLIAKHRVYVSTRFVRNKDGEYSYRMMKKDTINWYVSVVVIPPYFLYYSLSCILVALLVIFGFRFDLLFKKETYTEDNGVYDNFVSTLKSCIHPDYYSSGFDYVRSDKILDDKELVKQAKLVCEKEESMIINR